MAWSGKDPKNFNRSKFDILGIINESRGKHSCGISVDNILYKGIDNLKVYRDFAKQNQNVLPNTTPIVIGHTRHATGGAHNEINAHPFGFSNDNSNNHDFIGVHNGSLHNESDLAKKFNIDENVKVDAENNNINNYIYHRSKIDSEILLESIFKSNSYKVLSLYNGAAALVFYNVNEPNTIYCYHGASKLHKNSIEITEERPLYFYKENKNSLYISSIKSSLELIGGDDSTVGEFKHNTVYKIKNGDVDNSIKFNISRNGMCQKDTSYFNYSKPTSYQAYKPVTYKKLNNSNKKNNNSPDIINIHTERPLKSINAYKSIPYFNKLRWYRNGHLTTGIFTYIKNYGYYKLSSDSIKEAKDLFWKNVNQEFYNNEFIYNINNVHAMSYIPFKHTSNNEIINPPLYYIIEGVMLKTELDFEQISSHNKTSDIKYKFDTEALSYASKHPIINIDGINSYLNQNILLNGVRYTGRFTTLGSEKLYRIKNGNLIKEESINSNYNVGTGLNNRSTSKELAVIISDDLKKENIIKSKNNNSDELLFADINKMLYTFYTSVPSFIKQIAKYSKTVSQQKINSSMVSILSTIDDIINIEQIAKK